MKKKMEMRKLGRTNLEVSVIGFGGIPIQRAKESEATNIIQRAIDLGINFFDTSNDITYGDSEEKIGKAIKGRRGQVIISTKTKKKTRKEVIASIESSLQRLQIDYIDLYSFHNVGKLSEIEDSGCYKIMKKAQKSRKIGFIGISSHKSQVIDDAIASGKYDVVQYIFNPVKNKVDLVNKAYENNIGFVVMKPFAGGNILKVNLALKWILEHNVSTVIPGNDTMKHLEQNATVGNNYSLLNEKEKVELKESVKNLEGTICLACGYCKPYCPQEIQIPNMLYLWNYANKMGLPDKALSRFKKEIKVNPYDCIECGECEIHCPEEVEIRKRLKISADYFKKKKPKAFEKQFKR